MNEIEYAGLLRKSAMETARRMRTGGLAEESRSWGTLKAAILEELDDCPKPVREIAESIGKDQQIVGNTLRRLEAEGLAARAGTTRGANGTTVPTWIGRAL